MTTRQLKKLAKVHGWTLERHGGNHFVYRRGSDRVTVPYAARGFVGHNIAKQLLKTCATILCHIFPLWEALHQLANCHSL